MAGFWNADSDRDYADERDRYNEPHTTGKPRLDVRRCLKCRTWSALWHHVPGGVWCRFCHEQRHQKDTAA